MREIKFRCWNGKEMLSWRRTETEMSVRGWHQSDDYVLMQYTGLRDRNGVEIYEGDVVEFSVFDYNGHDEQYKGVVKFAACQWQVWHSNDSEFYGSDGAFDLYVVHRHDDEIEIIGNIWEQPELLK